MRAVGFRSAVVVLAIGVWATPGIVSAADVVAEPCSEDAVQCMSAPIAFSKTAKLPIEFDFDTGWIPPSSSLQVRLQALIAANTSVALRGALVAEWPHDDHAASFLLSAPGDPDGGLLEYHYGLLVDAQGKVNISIWPFNYTWQGPLPYVPQIDFQVQDELTFDAWGWEPGVEASSITETETLAQVDVSSLIGVSIPGVSAGFQLDAAVELTVGYTNQRIVIDNIDGEAVAGGPLLHADDDTHKSGLSGGYAELDVHPEGTVSYDGTLHLIPAFFVSLLGQNWSIPIVDVPLPFSIADVDWSFEPQRVHVPLPDLLPPIEEIDFGSVTLGDETFRTFKLANQGEATAVTMLMIAGGSFASWDSVLSIEPDEQLSPVLRFTPSSSGPHEAKLVLTSNDPDEPLRTILLRGEAIEPAVPPPSATGDLVADSDCGCQLVAARADDEDVDWAGLLLLGLGLTGLRRRRTRA